MKNRRQVKVIAPVVTFQTDRITVTRTAPGEFWLELDGETVAWFPTSNEAEHAGAVRLAEEASMLRRAA